MDRRARKLSRCRGARACGASRPAIRVLGTCDPKKPYKATGREKNRVRRITATGTRVSVTMVDGRVATYDNVARPACAEEAPQ